MGQGLREKSLAILTGLLLVGASVVAAVDKDQRTAFMDLATNVVIAYSGWSTGRQQKEEDTKKG